MTSPAKQLDNLKLHAPHIHMLAKGSLARRTEILKDASPKLVEALATGVRLLNENGVKFAKAHQRRARRMISRNTSKKTKKTLVSGQANKPSRGGGFWHHVGTTLLEIAPSAVPLIE